MGIAFGMPSQMTQAEFRNTSGISQKGDDCSPLLQKIMKLHAEMTGMTSTLVSIASSVPHQGSGLQDLVGARDVKKVDCVRRILDARRTRERMISADFFADPAWDILLDLYLADCLGQRVSVSSACVAASVPPTTALRWLKSLEAAGMVQRRENPLDARVVWVSLSPDAMARMDSYFDWFTASSGNDVV